eukprot:1157305-Pelagomonas_calceolata.AAC.14
MAVRNVPALVWNNCWSRTMKCQRACVYSAHRNTCVHAYALTHFSLDDTPAKLNLGTTHAVTKNSLSARLSFAQVSLDDRSATLTFGTACFMTRPYLSYPSCFLAQFSLDDSSATLTLGTTRVMTVISAVLEAPFPGEVWNIWRLCMALATPKDVWFMGQGWRALLAPYIGGCTDTQTGFGRCISRCLH